MTRLPLHQPLSVRVVVDREAGIVQLVARPEHGEDCTLATLSVQVGAWAGVQAAWEHLMTVIEDAVAARQRDEARRN